MKKVVVVLMFLLLVGLACAVGFKNIDYSVGRLEEGMDAALYVEFEDDSGCDVKLLQDDEVLREGHMRDSGFLMFTVPEPIMGAGGEMYDLRLECYVDDVLMDKKELGQMMGSLIYVEDGEEKFKYTSEPYKSDFYFGAVDFRVLSSDDDTVMPIRLQFENKLEFTDEFKFEVISVYMDGSYGTTESFRGRFEPGVVEKEFDFKVEDDEVNNDILIVVNWEGLEIGMLHNSLIRVKPETEGVPPTPSAILDREMEKLEQEMLDGKTLEEVEKEWESGKSLGEILDMEPLGVKKKKVIWPYILIGLGAALVIVFVFVMKKRGYRSYRRRRRRF